jgi:hypothetical protein
VNTLDEINMRRVADILGMPFPDEMNLAIFFITQEIYREKIAYDEKHENENSEWKLYQLKKKLKQQLEQHNQFDPKFIQVEVFNKG